MIATILAEWKRGGHQLPDAADAAVEPAKVPGRRRRVLIAVCASLVVATAITGVRVYLHHRHDANDLLPYTPYGLILSNVQVGRTVYTDIDVRLRHDPLHGQLIDLRRVTPRVATNTAHATIAILICAPGFGGAVGPYTTRPSCSRTGPFSPGLIRLEPDGTTLVYAVTLQRLGAVRIAGAQISYYLHSRSGNQNTGDELIVHGPRAQ